MARKRVNQKEAGIKLVALMKKWQDIEETSIKSIRDLTKSIKNPLVKRVLQIIMNDSIQHKAVQQFIVDSFEKQAIILTPEDLAEVWSSIEKHIEMEKETVRLGMEAKELTTNFVHKYFINYLLTEERKHDELLEQLENLKNKIYPYA